MASKNADQKPGFGQEALAVLGLFLSLFLFLALFAEALELKKNWCGEIGKIIAGFLFGFTGWGGYLLPCLLLFVSIQFFRGGLSSSRLPQVTLGLSGVVLAGCGLLSSLAISDPELLGAGGFVGKTVFVLLKQVAGNGGTVLLLTLVLLISLMLATQFSPYLLVVAGWAAVCKMCSLLWQRITTHSPPKTKKSDRDRGPGPAVQVQAVQEVAPPSPAPASAPSVPVLKEPMRARKASEKEEEFAAAPVARGDWRLPPLTLLAKGESVVQEIDKDTYFKVSLQLEQKLKNFGVSGKVVGISPGPVVTTYEYAPAPGVKINKIVGLADDLALGLRAQSVRVVGSIPGKAALGIEIPNDLREVVYLRDIIGNEIYRKASHKLTIALGLDVVGNLALANLAKMPHLLIAGATGAGKSVGINTIIASILFNATPAEVRFLMIDPKRIELSGYEGIPHLLHPVVVDPKQASRALNWAVREMERRYRLLEEAKVKSFDSYNAESEEKLPYIVVIVDELADLMMVASKDVESSIARLAQMARAAGIHLILATQRPSVDVLTGLIKANFPTRISFKVSSKIDSRTILDASGAEHLLGMGDMLFLAPGTASIRRIHGAFISEKETAAIVDFLKEQGGGSYDEAIVEDLERGAAEGGEEGEADLDERYDEAVAIVCEAGQASISMVQRRLRIGYNRAARIIEMMEREGVVGPADGAKPREVIVRSDYQ